MRSPPRAAPAVAVVSLVVLPLLLLSRPTSLYVVDTTHSSTDASLRTDEHHPTRAPTPDELAAPWVAPSNVSFPYEGLHNDLKRLLEIQASQGRISLTFFTASQTSLLLNCVYSLVKYGGVTSYIVATVDQESLTQCQGLRLPCYDASAAVDHAFDHGEAGYHDVIFASKEYRALVHAKPVIVHEVFQLKPKLLHWTDVDISYVREVWPSYLGFMKRAGDADAVFMNEYGSINSGNFVLRYSDATAALVRRWALVDGAGASSSSSSSNGDGTVAINGAERGIVQQQQQVEIDGQQVDATSSTPPTNAAQEREKHFTDQDLLRSLRGDPYEVCDDKNSCETVRASGRAALVLHPPQFNVVSWTGHCPGYIDWPSCAPYTLYIHTICTSGTQGKRKWLELYNLWHLQEDDFTPVADRHAYLPCANPVAWETSGLRGEEPAIINPDEVAVMFPALVKAADTSSSAAVVGI